MLNCPKDPVKDECCEVSIPTYEQIRGVLRKRRKLQPPLPPNPESVNISNQLMIHNGEEFIFKFDKCELQVPKARI